MATAKVGGDEGCDPAAETSLLLPFFLILLNAVVLTRVGHRR